MKTYRVLASYTTYCSMTIEAENKDEAYEFAIRMDGGAFDHDTHGDWSIDQVTEEEQCKQE